MTSTRLRQRTWAITVPLLLALLVAATGCGGGTQTSASGDAQMSEQGDDAIGLPDGEIGGGEGTDDADTSDNTSDTSGPSDTSVPSDTPDTSGQSGSTDSSDRSGSKSPSNPSAQLSIPTVEPDTSEEASQPSDEAPAP